MSRTLDKSQADHHISHNQVHHPPSYYLTAGAYNILRLTKKIYPAKHKYNYYPTIRFFSPCHLTHHRSSLTLASYYFGNRDVEIKAIFVYAGGQKRKIKYDQDLTDKFATQTAVFKSPHYPVAHVFR